MSVEEYEEKPRGKSESSCGVYNKIGRSASATSGGDSHQVGIADLKQKVKHRRPNSLY